MGIPMEKNVSSTDSAAEIAKVVEDVDMNEVNNQHVDLIEETGKSSRSDQLNDEKVVSMPEKPRQEEHFQMKTHESAMDNRGEPMDFTLRSEDACLGLRSNDDLNDTLEAGSGEKNFNQIYAATSILNWIIKFSRNFTWSEFVSFRCGWSEDCGNCSVHDVERARSSSSS